MTARRGRPAHNPGTWATPLEQPNPPQGGPVGRHMPPASDFYVPGKGPRPAQSYRGARRRVAKWKYRYVTKTMPEHQRAAMQRLTTPRTTPERGATP